MWIYVCTVRDSYCGILDSLVCAFDVQFVKHSYAQCSAGLIRELFLYAQFVTYFWSVLDLLVCVVGDAFVCAVQYITYSCMRGSWLIPICAVRDLCCGAFDSVVCAVGESFVRAVQYMTHSYMRGSWLVSMCAVRDSFANRCKIVTRSYVSWLIYISSMTHSYM